MSKEKSMPLSMPVASLLKTILRSEDKLDRELANNVLFAVREEKLVTIVRRLELFDDFNKTSKSFLNEKLCCEIIGQYEQLFGLTIIDKLGFFKKFNWQYSQLVSRINDDLGTLVNASIGIYLVGLKPNDQYMLILTGANSSEDYRTEFYSSVGRFKG